jgi:hypothetical protein
MEKFRLYFTQTPRLVWVCDEESGQYLILATNELSWTADTISQLYKARWAIDSFFKHLKPLFPCHKICGRLQSYRSHNGAKRTAMFYTFFANCQLNGVYPKNGSVKYWK